MKTYEVEVDGAVYLVKLREVEEGSVPVSQPVSKVAISPTTGTKIVAPMSGKILSVSKKVGDSVTKGEDIAILEAMKMETAIQAPVDGIVQEILVSPNQVVDTDELLMVI